jgi:hypothetical protein
MPQRIFQEFTTEFIGLYAASWYERGQERVGLFVMDDFGNLVGVF